MKQKLSYLLLVVFAFPVALSAAEYSDYGTFVDVTIDADNVAHFDLSIPCTQNESVYFYHQLKSYGSTGVDILYEGGSVDGSKQFINADDPEADVEAGCADDSTRAHFKYKVKSTVSGLVYIYEFAFPYASSFPYFKKYFVDLTLPPSLAFVSASKQPVMNPNGTMRFVYEFGGDGTLQGDTFTLVLTKKPLPTGASTVNLSGVTITGYDRSIARFKKLEKYVPQVEQLFKETLGVSLGQKKIHAFVTNVNKIPLFYEAGGVFIPPDIILLDDSSVAASTDMGLLQLFVHETTHAISTADRSGNGMSFNAPWFSEGLAVFHQQYFIDKYLSSTVSEADAAEVLGAYKKFSIEELPNKYSYDFDYDFMGESKQPIADSYAHAGLAMYRLFVDDPQIFKKLNAYLSAMRPDYSCQSCDTDKILSNITFITKKTPAAVTQPFKFQGTIPEKYKILFARKVDSSVVKKIETTELKKVETYFGADTPVADVAPSEPVKKSTTTKPVVEKTPTPVIAKKIPVDKATTSETVAKPIPVTEQATSQATSTPAVKKNGGFIGWIKKLFGL